MRKNWLEKQVSRWIRDYKFEVENWKYFLPHYIRIIVLMILVAVAVYYGSYTHICENIGGVLQSGENFISWKCANATVSQVFLP